MSEIEFTLKVRWHAEPGVDGYEDCSTVDECIAAERSNVESGSVGIPRFIEIMGEFSEMVWDMREVPEGQDLQAEDPRIRRLLVDLNSLGRIHEDGYIEDLAEKAREILGGDYVMTEIGEQDLNPAT